MTTRSKIPTTNKGIMGRLTENTKVGITIIGMTIVIMTIAFTATRIAINQVDVCGLPETRACRVAVVRFSHALDDIVTSFKDEMKRMGYKDETSIEYMMDDPDAKIETLDARIAALIARKPDLIFSISTPASSAVKRLNEKLGIPVLFQAFDPIGSSLVESIAHPGRNMTGIRHGDAEQKRLEWLTLLVPGTKRVFVPYNPLDGSASASVASIKIAAELLRLDVTYVEVRAVEDIKNKITDMPMDIQALFMPADSLVASQIPFLVEETQKRKIPLSVVVGQDVRKGALFSYGFDFGLEGKQFARLADLLLRKKNLPGELPIETAEYGLTINMPVSEQLGLDINKSLLMQARKLLYARDLQPATPSTTTAP